MQVDLAGAINTLAAKLAVPAQMLWGALLAQARIEAIKSVILVIVIAAFLAAFAWVFVWSLKKFDAENTDGEAYIPVAIASGIVSLVLSIMTIIYTCSAIFNVLDAMNPQYFALHEILRAVGR